MNQEQPVRTGDVYPPTSAKREASHERDKIIEHGQQRGDDLHVEETTLPAGRRMVTATAGGQVMAQFAVPVPEGTAAAEDADAVTIAEAIDAAAQTSAGDRPVGVADAAAVQAAEMRATGLQGNVSGGVATRAQQAREMNARLDADGGGGGEKQQVTLRDVVRGKPMPADKVATREDARMVKAAAARHVGNKGAGDAGGVADAVVAAADMNEGRMM